MNFRVDTSEAGRSRRALLDVSWLIVTFGNVGSHSNAARRRIIRGQYDQYGREVGTSMFDSSERPVRSRN